MEKIAIKGNGGGGGGTTFQIVSTPTIVMSSTGTNGDLTLKDGATTNNFYFNLIGGQFLGANNVDRLLPQASKSPYRGIIENGTIYFAIGDVTSDDGSQIDCIIGFYDGENNTLDAQQITLTQNQYFNYTLSTWDGNVSDKNIYIRIGTIEPYTFASLQIGGWSFGIR